MINNCGTLIVVYIRVTHIINTKYMRYQNVSSLTHSLPPSFWGNNITRRNKITHTLIYTLVLVLPVSSIILTCILQEYIKRKVLRMPTFIEGGMDAKYGDISAPLWFCL